MVLALPSPACRDRVGEVLGDRRVDRWGDEVRWATLAPWPAPRSLHDMIGPKWK